MKQGGSVGRFVLKWFYCDAVGLVGLFDFTITCLASKRFSFSWSWDGGARFHLCSSQ